MTEKTKGLKPSHKNPLLGHELVCSHCGADAKCLFTPSTNREMVEKELCFTCLFWMEKTKPSIRDSEATARINGTHFRIGPPRNWGSMHFRGYRGAKFVIKFDDGRIVETTNLWCQGLIPESFREELPNNAVFLQIDLFREIEHLDD